MKQEYLIGELAEFFGVSRDTLRLYDKAGIISPRKSKENNYRYYTREELICLTYVMELRKINLPLEEIRIMMNESSIEHAAQAMEAQEILLEEKIKELQRHQQIVWDYKTSFKTAIQDLNEIQITESPVFIYKLVEDSLISTLEEFSNLTDKHVPKFTFVVPKELFLSEGMKHSVNECKQEFLYAVTMKDDENLTTKEDFPTEKFQVVKYDKCIYTVMKFYTFVDYSDISYLREYVLANGHTLAGDVLLRVVSLKHSAVKHIDYYETWVPIK